MILWKGKDMEGIHKSMKTLFIGSPDITVNEIEDELNKDGNIKQLYFGAGETTQINEDTLRTCVNKFSYLTISAEINLDDLHTYNLKSFVDVEVVVSITHKNIYLLPVFKVNDVQIKLQTLDPKPNKYLTMTRFNTFNNTDMRMYVKKVYETDEVIR